MDRNFYQQKLAQLHQHEISQELATRNLLRGLKGERGSAKQAKSLALRIASAVIVMTILILIYFLH